MTINRICIIGPGAIGGMMAVKLMTAGFEVSTIVRPLRVDALRRDGITLHDDGETFHAIPTIATDTKDLGPQDLVIITVKETALADIAPSVAPLLHETTQVVQIMNGIPWWFFAGFDGPHEGAQLQSVDRDGCVSRHLDLSRHIGGVINCGVSWQPDGSLRHDHSNELFIGRPDNDSAGVDDVAEVFRNAGYNTTVAERIQQKVMEKLAANVSFNPVSALTMATTDLMLGDELVSDTLLGLMMEVRAITQALGLDPGPDPTARIKGGSSLKASKTSMLQDMEAGKPLELAGILAATIEAAALVDVSVPLTRTVYGLLRLREETARRGNVGAAA